MMTDKSQAANVLQWIKSRSSNSITYNQLCDKFPDFQIPKILSEGVQNGTLTFNSRYQVISAI